MIKLRNSGIYAIVLLTAIPVLWWFFSLPLAGRFYDIWTALGTVGKGLGIAGFMLFAINLILSGRPKFLEKFFGSLDRLYRIHHIVGGVAFLCLLFHPLFTAFQFFAFSPLYAWQFLIDLSNREVLYGKIALFMMVVLLGLTFYGRMKHETWRWTHKFLGLAFFFGALHAFFIQGEIASHPWLVRYLMMSATIGILMFLWRSVFRLYKLSEHRYIVSRIEKKGEMITEVYLKPLGKPMQFRGGQFVFLRFKLHGQLGEPHPYTIASSAQDAEIRFCIKNLGDYSALVDTVPVGTEARIEGPWGAFNYTRGGEKQIWIAGGIGITPFLGMLPDLVHQNDPTRRIHIYYCAKTAAELMYREELEALAVKTAGTVTLHAYCSDKDGNFSLDAVERVSGSLEGASLLVCGPPGMMKMLKEQSVAKNIPSSSFIIEDFSLSKV